MGGAADGDAGAPGTAPVPVAPSGDPAVAAADADQPVRGAADIRNDELAHLLATAAEGDEQAFSQLYDRTSSRVYGVALRVLRSPDHAAEVTQEVFVDVWRQATRYSPGRGSVLAWITTMAHRRAVDRVRSVTSESARDVKYAVENVGVEHDEVWAGVDQQLDVQLVRRGLEQLSSLQREALTLAYFGGYSQSQVAERLGVPLGTAKTRIRDGLSGLRSVLGVTT